MKNFRKNKGFTLIEVSLALLVSVSVLAGVGYLYLNASTAQQGDAAGNEVVSAATLGFTALEGTAPADAATNLGLAMESGNVFVGGAGQWAATNTVPAYIAVDLNGPGTITNSWPAGKIPQNICTLIYNKVITSGYYYQATAPVGVINSSVTLATACPAGGTATSTVFLVKASVL